MNTTSDRIFIIINGKVIIDAKQGKGAQTVGLKLTTYKARKRGIAHAVVVVWEGCLECCDVTIGWLVPTLHG